VHMLAHLHVPRPMHGFRVPGEPSTTRHGVQLLPTCTSAVSLSLPSALTQKPLMTCEVITQVNHLALVQCSASSQPRADAPAGCRCIADASLPCLPLF
jgi:hypothetical protein